MRNTATAPHSRRSKITTTTVDTFEEEEEVDIKAVMAEIKSLEAKRADLDAQIDVYLKELGIID